MRTYVRFETFSDVAHLEAALANRNAQKLVVAPAASNIDASCSLLINLFLGLNSSRPTWQDNIEEIMKNQSKNPRVTYVDEVLNEHYVESERSLSDRIGAFVSLTKPTERYCLHTSLTRQPKPRPQATP
jgi:hypothetical protein